MNDETTQLNLRRRRVLFGCAGSIALAVTGVFLILGDGVDVPEAAGVRRVVIEYGHTTLWALLAIAFFIATVRGRWGRVPNGIALAAGAIYALFLFAVFVWK